MKASRLKIGIFVVVMIGMSFLTVSCKLKFWGDKQEAAPVSSYVSKDSTYKIGYPEAWEKKDDDPTKPVAFLSPKEDSNDIFRENVNVMIQDLSKNDGPKTLDEYVSLSIKSIETEVKESKILTSEKIKFAGLDGYKLVYSGKSSGYSLKWLQMFTLKEDKVYLVTYTAMEDKFDTFLPMAEQTMNSFNFQ